MNSKLTLENIEKIRILHTQGMEISDIAKQFNVSGSTIRRVILENFPMEAEKPESGLPDPLESVAFAKCLKYLVLIGKVTAKFDPQLPWNNLTDEVLYAVADELCKTWGDREITPRDWEKIYNYYADKMNEPHIREKDRRI